MWSTRPRNVASATFLHTGKLDMNEVVQQHFSYLLSLGQTAIKEKRKDEMAKLVNV
jgi:hypothetical protein